MRSGRRVRYVSKNETKNQRAQRENRYVLQKLAANYYGSRPPNYLSREGKSSNAKSHQLIRPGERGSISMKKSSKPESSGQKALRNIHNQKERITTLQQQMHEKIQIRKLRQQELKAAANSMNRQA